MIENGKRPETGVVQVSCSSTSDGMYFPVDDDPDENIGKKVSECYCLYNHKNGYNYDCDLIENWKQEECKCDGYGICQKELDDNSTPCLCRDDGLCVQNEYDMVSYFIY